jgi:hypothetical protein
MSNASSLFRSLVIYGLTLPLAVALGYLLATPFDLTTVSMVGIILVILTIPLFLRWHHAWLIASWNSMAVVFVLPGRPQIWVCMAGISFAIAVLQFTINRNLKFLHVPSLTRPLLFLTAVVLVTARLTGGIGLRAFGSAVYGGKYYVLILAAVIGYFALTSRPIPPKKGLLYATLFFLGFGTSGIGELSRVLPSSFNFLFLVFPLLKAPGSATDVVGPTGDVLGRLTGLGWMGTALFTVLLARYGLRGVFFEPGKPWRPVLFAISVVAGLTGGFRSTLITFIMTLGMLFYLERLYRTRLMPLAMLSLVLLGTLVTVFADRMPMPIQRSMAFLPVNIDPVARLNAQASSEWRLKVWRDVLPQVPQYLILGKGYGFSGSDLALVKISERGQSNLESTELVGDYHNGPLSVLIPFGLFGLAGFVWFVWAGLRVAYQNYQFGDPAYRHINAFIFASLVVKLVFFLLVFGAFPSDIGAMVGLIGLSVALNAGVAKPAFVPQPKIVFNRFRLHPSVRRPVGA